MDTAEFKTVYARIKEIGRRGSEPGRSTQYEFELLVDTIYSDGTRQQKGALSRLLQSWGADEEANEMASTI